MEVISKQGQWLGDIAVRDTGTFETAFEYAVANNVSITDPLAIGRLFETVAAADKRVVNFLDRNAIVPATALATDVQEGIDFWYVEYDFVVS